LFLLEFLHLVDQVLSLLLSVDLHLLHPHLPQPPLGLQFDLLLLSGNLQSLVQLVFELVDYFREALAFGCFASHRMGVFGSFLLGLSVVQVSGLVVVLYCLRSALRRNVDDLISFFH